jgi:ribokinase
MTPPAVDPVDTTGAGDVLNGFLAARLAAGDGFPRALSLAVHAASLSTTEAGARGGIPTLEVVESFREQGERTD